MRIATSPSPPHGNPLRRLSFHLFLFRLFLTPLILDPIVDVVLLASDDVAWLILGGEPNSFLSVWSRVVVLVGRCHCAY